MESQAESGAIRSNPRYIIGAVILVALAGAILLFALVGPTMSAGGLLPMLATPTTPPDDPESLAPIPVTFTELNSNPVNYLNLPIQVSGSYMKLESPSCPRYSGPTFQWALVSEDLQLDAKGFERVIRILEPGAAMTVQGIWRLYQGPLGCGKGAPSSASWYLQVQRIIQPNPLVGNGSARPVDIEGADLSLPALVPTDIPTLTPTTTPTQVTLTPSATATATVNQIVPTITLQPSSTPDNGVIATPSSTPSLATNTPDPAGTPAPSPTASATAATGPGDGGNNATSTPLPPLPPTATQSSGEYPGPPTSTPTATLDPYP